MAFTDYLQWTSGSALYAKPLPLVDGGSWAADKIDGVENGTLGSYAFASLSDGIPYVIYEAVAGAGNEANTDPAVGQIAASSITSEDVANLVLAGLDAGTTITVVNTYDPETKKLTIVQRADYVNAAVSTPLKFQIEATGVVAGDIVNFGAKKTGQPSIFKAGTVVDENGDLFAVIELTKETETDRKAGSDWRWELEHVDGSGNITPLIVDQKLTIKPSQSDPII